MYVYTFVYDSNKINKYYYCHIKEEHFNMI